MSKYYKVILSGEGGEYAYGMVNGAMKAALLDRINNNVDIDPVGDNDTQMFDCTVQLVHEYSPYINNDLRITVVECDADGNDLSEIAYEELVSDHDINEFQWDNPDPSEECEYITDDMIGFGGILLEDKVYSTFIVCTDEEFKFENLHIGTLNLDETLEDSEVVHALLYICDDHKQQLSEILEIETDELSEFNEIFSDNFTEFYDAEESFRNVVDVCDSSLYEASGSSPTSYTYVVVRDEHNDILYEKDV